MQRDVFFGEMAVLDRDQVFTAGGEVVGQVVGERTLLDLGDTAQRYKLADAYASVRNLEFVVEEEEKTQTFQEYLELQREIRAKPFRSEVKLRPRYPKDEAYRNRKLPFLYRRGDMLILVEKSLYPAVSRALNRYVLDAGRDGYWATVHVVEGGTPEDARADIARRRPFGCAAGGRDSGALV